jgi:hypothetical protein
MARNSSTHASTTDAGCKHWKTIANAEPAELLLVLDLSVFTNAVENGYFSSKLRKRR